MSNSSDKFNEMQIREIVSLSCELLGMTPPSELRFTLRADDEQPTYVVKWVGTKDTFNFVGEFWFAKSEKLGFEAHLSIARRIIFDMIIATTPFRKHLYQAIALYKQYPRTKDIQEAVLRDVANDLLKKIMFWRK